MVNEYNHFINECWSQHDKNTENVAKKLCENLKLIDSKEKTPAYVSIVVHTFGGHLGQWQEGKELLLKISELDTTGGHQSIYRGLATLSYCANDQSDFSKYSELSTEENSIVRIYASAATELIAQGQTGEATQAFKSALNAIPKDLSQGDPTARTIAISGNNMACELEEKADKSKDDIELMLTAAKTARTYWEIAGGWLEVERAEYRLGMSYLQAGQLHNALKHARICETLCQENHAAPIEHFFAHEALTLINRAICKELRNKVSPEDQAYCIIP